MERNRRIGLADSPHPCPCETTTDVDPHYRGAAVDPTLNIAEIPYESGAIRYRYSRILGPDGTRWLRHGRFVAYAESGSVISEGMYVNGKEHGEWKDFHPSGQLAAHGRYEDGAEVGPWHYWDENGNPE